MCNHGPLFFCQSLLLLTPLKSQSKYTCSYWLLVELSSFEDCLLGKYLGLKQRRSHFSTAVLVVGGQYWIGFEMRRTIHHSNRSFHRSRDKAGGGRPQKHKLSVSFYTQLHNGRSSNCLWALWQLKPTQLGAESWKFQK